MERWQNCVAAVTGASAGIGAAISRQLLAAGLTVAGLARRRERLEQLRAELPPAQRERFHVLVCDVSDLQAVNAAFDQLQAQLGGIDILINNAGKLLGGQLLNMPLAAVQQLVQTNIMAAVYCTQRVFKSLQQRQAAGHVFLINSIVGHYLFNPPPGSKQELNMYPVTKHAVTALTELWRQEFRDLKTSTKITSISPGLVDTELVPQAYKALPMLQPDDVAQAIMYALATPPHVQVHELIIKPMGEPF